MNYQSSWKSRVVDLYTWRYIQVHVLCAFHSPWEIVDPYPVLVNYNASRHHPNENLCVALVLKRGEQSV